MSDFSALLSSLPIDQIAAQLGADPQAVAQASQAALPALLGGLAANAEDPAGEASLISALSQHTDDLASDGQVALDRVNTADGERITQHVFGANTEPVVNQLGGLPGVSPELIKKLLPILAPIVLSYLAKQLGQNSSAASGGVGGGLIGQILQQVLAGAAQGAGPAGSASSAGSSMGSILGDVLGGLLGAGRRQ